MLYRPGFRLRNGQMKPVSPGVTARGKELKRGIRVAAIWSVSLAAGGNVKGGSSLGPAELPTLMSVYGDDLWVMARVSFLAVSNDDASYIVSLDPSTGGDISEAASLSADRPSTSAPAVRVAGRDDEGEGLLDFLLLLLDWE